MLDGEFGAFERLLRIVWVRRASAFFVVLGGHEPQRATNQVCTTSGYRRWFALSNRLAGSVSGNARIRAPHDRTAPGEPNVQQGRYCDPDGPKLNCAGAGQQ